ncbi:MGMT family protein [Alteromonas sp. A081]|uniref:MGMT family protein n=1 Tax=Alteromonas sp. A081 TaxID=3410269 RepID=UPI003B97EDA4
MIEKNAIKLRVEKTLSLVPSGKVVSYGQLADLCGLPGRARLMGKYLRLLDGQHNWHRVLRANGKIAFPFDSELGREQSARLLMEGVLVKNGGVSIKDYGWQPDLYTVLFTLEY